MAGSFLLPTDRQRRHFDAYSGAELTELLQCASHWKENVSTAGSIAAHGTPTASLAADHGGKTAEGATGYEPGPGVA